MSSPLVDNFKEFVGAVKALSKVRRSDFKGGESVGRFSFLSVAFVLIFLSVLILIYSFIRMF